MPFFTFFTTFYGFFQKKHGFLYFWKKCVFSRLIFGGQTPSVQRRQIGKNPTWIIQPFSVLMHLVCDFWQIERKITNYLLFIRSVGGLPVCFLPSSFRPLTSPSPPSHKRQDQTLFFPDGFWIPKGCPTFPIGFLSLPPYCSRDRRFLLPSPPTLFSFCSAFHFFPCLPFSSFFFYWFILSVRWFLLRLPVCFCYSSVWVFLLVRFYGGYAALGF